jgi:ribose transport system permease protein
MTRNSPLSRARTLFSRPGAGIALFLIVVSLVMSMVSPVFLTWMNWSNMFNQASLLILLAMGMTIVLIGGGIDLSVGAIAALSGGVVAFLIATLGTPLWLALIAGILVGLALGLMNGLIITVMQIPDFVTTLAMMALIRGVLFVWTQGVPMINYSDKTYILLGGLTRLPLRLTVPEFITAAILGIGLLIMTYARVASHLKATGENPDVARLSGVNVAAIKIGTYAVSGLLAGIAGVLMAGKLGTVQPNMASGIEVQALAAAIIGGAALTGGRGSLLGAALGAITLVVIQNVINLLGVPPVFETFVIGMVILVVIILERLSAMASAGPRLA